MSDKDILLNAAKALSIRAKMLVKTYFDAPNDVEIDLSIGNIDPQTPAIAVQIADGPLHAFSAAEARDLAQAIETCLGQHPALFRTGIDDLMMLLRMGADKAEALAASEKTA